MLQKQTGRDPVGLQIVLETETGKSLASLEDPTNILHGVLPTEHDLEFHYLNLVDWYGDTTFNRLQIPKVREELARLIERTTSSADRQLLVDIDRLAAKGESEPHLYLKFYGD